MLTQIEENHGGTMKKNFERLQLGKWYRRRDGEIVQIVEENSYGYPFFSSSVIYSSVISCSEIPYQSSGDSYYGSHPNPLDLIEELPDELVQKQQTEFERGRASVIQELKETGVLDALEFYGDKTIWGTSKRRGKDRFFAQLTEWGGGWTDFSEEQVPHCFEDAQYGYFLNYKIAGKRARECLPKLKKIMGEE